MREEVRRRFSAEAHVIARLAHANIVQVFDVGEQEVRPFLSLELVEGGTLAQWTAGKPQPANVAAQIIATLARAVQYAHDHGVVHRDLKPDNVLLSKGTGGVPDLKITDFGIAKVVPQRGGAPIEMAQPQRRELSPTTGRASARMNLNFSKKL